MSNSKFGAKEVMNCTLYDMSTKKPVIYFDTLKTSEIDVTSEKKYARGGRANTKLLTWEVNKEATLKIEDALLSPKSMELLSGVARSVGAQTLAMRQDSDWDTTGAIPFDKGDLFPLTATSGGAITLAFTPSDAVADIVVYDATDDCGTPISMSGANLVGKVLTVSGAANKKVVVYYNFLSASSTETYVIDAEHFSGTYKLVGDTIIRNMATGKDEPFQVTIPNLKWSSALKLGFSADGDPVPQSFDCEIQKSATSSTLIQMSRWA